MAFPARRYKQLRAIHASYKRRGFYGQGIPDQRHRFQSVYQARKGIADTVRLHRRLELPLADAPTRNSLFHRNVMRVTAQNLIDRANNKLTRIRRPSTRGRLLGEILATRINLRRRLL